MAKTVRPMFWIYGNNRQTKQTWDKIVEKLGGEGNVLIKSIECGYNSQEAVCKVAEASDVAILLRQKDLFDTRPRIIKLRGLPDNYVILNDFLQYVNDSNILVICGSPGYRGKGNRWVSAATSKFFKTIKEQGRVFEFPTEANSDNAAIAWCENIASESGKKFGENAASKLVNLVGKNYDILESETIKLCSYQNGKEISIEDINTCCNFNNLDEVWSFIDFLDNRDIDKSIMYLQKFYDIGVEKGETFYGNVSMLLGALEQHYLFLLLVRHTCGQELDVQKIQDSIQGIRKFGSEKKLYELAKGMIKAEDIGTYFSPQYIRMNCSKPSLVHLLNWPYSKIHWTYILLEECKFACRANSGNENLIKLFLDVLVSTICDKFSYSNALNIFKSSVRFV